MGVRVICKYQISDIISLHISCDIRTVVLLLLDVDRLREFSHKLDHFFRCFIFLLGFLSISFAILIFGIGAALQRA